MKPIWSRLKPFLRWAILGATLFFLGKVLKENWQGVAAIRLDGVGWAALAIALGITLLAHICAGWVWGWILQDFQQPIGRVWVIQVYLKTNIAKYLPGNVWHYYGRIAAITKAGADLGAATVSVLLEPLLMAASALLITLLSGHQIAARYGWSALTLQGLGLIAVLCVLHPAVLNRFIHRLGQMKQSAIGNEKSVSSFQLSRYPLRSLLGEIGFLVLRGIGFLLTVLAVSPIAPTQWLVLLSGFSLAWLLGLVVPGAPGGIGVFEATAIALLGQQLAPERLLAAVALYRLVSVLAETTGAGLAWLDQRMSHQADVGNRG